MPSPTGKIKALDNARLRKMVEDAIRQEGPYVDLNWIDVHGVVDLGHIFANLPFRGNISSWDTSCAESMNSMFYFSPFNGDISKWDVSRVTSFENMFVNCPFNQDISNWDTSCVTTMYCMFMSTSFTGDISNWNVSNVRTFEAMFDSCPFKGDLSRWNFHPNANTANMVETFALFAMTDPCVLHWLQAFAHKSTALGMTSSEWQDHFNAHYDVLQGLALNPMEASIWLQRQWLAKMQPPQELALPNLDSP